jgi:glycosyltransferase involved in cell wall biosynthesis
MAGVDHLGEWVAAASYVLAGPGVWGVFWLANVKGRARLRLRPTPLPVLSVEPGATVIVPCKDEAAGITACVESILRQDWPNLELIVVDDRSTDGTGDVLDRLAARHPNMRVIHVRDGELPPGWWGKTHAMHLGAAAAGTDWLVFTDSDCTLAPGAVRAGVVTGEAREFDLVSFVPRFVGTRFWDKLMTPLCGICTSAMYALMFANNAQQKNTAFACGQYMAIRKTIYDRVGGWAAIRHLPADDVEIARLLKRAGHRPRLGWGMDLVTARMYGDFRSIFFGWGRNFIAASRGGPSRVVGALLFLFFSVLSIYPAIAWGIYRQMNPINALGGMGWLATAALHAILITTGLASGYKWGGSRAAYALLWPLGTLVLVPIFARSLYLCATKKLDWRGVTYTLDTAAAVPSGTAPNEARGPVA